MPTISEFFSAQHRSCDVLLGKMEAAVDRDDWQRAEILFDQVRAETLQHFENEEQGLFPMFEQATGMRQGPTQVMRSEHGELRELLQSLGAAIQVHDQNAVLGTTETFFLFLQQHNVKEEQVLYPMADQALQDSLSVLSEKVPGFSGGS